MGYLSDLFSLDLTRGSSSSLSSGFPFSVVLVSGALFVFGDRLGELATAREAKYSAVEIIRRFVGVNAEPNVAGDALFVSSRLVSFVCSSMFFGTPSYGKSSHL